MSRNIQVIVSMLVLALAATASLANTGIFVVNGDINAPSDPTLTYTGLGVVSDSPTNTYWNPLVITNGVASSTLKESDGTTDSGITFTIFSSENSVTFGATGTPSPTDLFRDIVYSAINGTVTFEFDHVPAGNYALYAYSVNGSVQNAHTSFTITTGGTASDTVTNSSAPTFAFENNYVVLGGLSPVGVGGVIAGHFTDLNSTRGSLNGFQLVQLPEPASLGLLAVGGVTLLKRRRRA